MVLTALLLTWAAGTMLRGERGDPRAGEAVRPQPRGPSSPAADAAERGRRAHGGPERKPGPSSTWDFGALKQKALALTQRVGATSRAEAGRTCEACTQTGPGGGESDVVRALRASVKAPPTDAGRLAPVMAKAAPGFTVKAPPPWAGGPPEAQRAGGAGGPGMGVCRALLDALRTQERATELLQAGRLAQVMAYTFDVEEIVEGLVGLKRRGGSVAVLVDRKFANNGRCRGQYAALARLQAEGIPVFASDGQNRRSFGGAMHTKAIRVDQTLLVGSCNWTGASRGNFELGTEIDLSDTGRREFEAIFLGRLSQATPWRQTSREPTGSGGSRGSEETTESVDF